MYCRPLRLTDICGFSIAGPQGAHPQDYLQFFAPGNRESVQLGEAPPKMKAPGGGGAELAQLSRRFMIYVHSKMLIVDDEVRFATHCSFGLWL